MTIIKCDKNQINLDSRYLIMKCNAEFIKGKYRVFFYRYREKTKLSLLITNHADNNAETCDLKLTVPLATLPRTPFRLRQSFCQTFAILPITDQKYWIFATGLWKLARKTSRSRSQSSASIERTLIAFLNLQENKRWCFFGNFGNFLFVECRQSSQLSTAAASGRGCTYFDGKER